MTRATTMAGRVAQRVLAGAAVRLASRRLGRNVAAVDPVEAGAAHRQPGLGATGRAVFFAPLDVVVSVAVFLVLAVFLVAVVLATALLTVAPPRQPLAHRRRLIR